MIKKTNDDSYLKFWTNINIENPKLNDFKDFKIRCYFDNDSDELINFHGNNGLVDLEVYKEMLISIKKMGYNAVDIHDQLGRAEFYIWDSYKKYWNYKGDIEHINKIIDLIHEQGMLVQIPMYLAWGFNPIDENADCWSQHKDLWIKKWNEYMDSPLGKGDIFLLRPRSPIYDYPYGCKCKQCTDKGTGQLMTEAFKNLENIILKRKPNATLLCDLYAEGYPLWEDNSFSVSENWMLMVSDNGFGKLPNHHTMGSSNHKWGIYLHAGFWLNHTVQDPHLDALYNSIELAYKKNMTNYILVNGQNFKDFKLNLEAIMSLIQKKYNKNYNLYSWKESFLKDWFKRLFNANNELLLNEMIDFISKQAEFHLNISVKKAYLDEMCDVDRGFIVNMISYVYPLIEEVNNKVTSVNYKISNEYLITSHFYNKICTFLIQSQNMVSLAENIESKLSEDYKTLWVDQFKLPQLLFVYQYKLIQSLLDVLNDKIEPIEAKNTLTLFYKLAEKGSGLKGFENWYNPKNSRMHHPIPTSDIFNF